jgi:hypothetical protein
MWRMAGVSGGKGFVLVSHTAEIFPSGFLPITAGNVLRGSPIDEGKARDLRISEGMRRVGVAGLCADGKISGGRCAVYLSAAVGGSHCGVTTAKIQGQAGRPVLLWLRPPRRAFILIRH